MTTNLDDRSPAAGADAPVPDRTDRSARAALRALAMRLHFYAGVFVGPFLLVAALSGALYAATPMLEDAVYDHELHVPAAQSSLPLAEQIRAAQQVMGGEAPSAVRPAPKPGDTTRVMFSDPSLGDSTSRAIFVNPADGEVRGDLPVYGTSGVLPLRTWIDDFHRSLHLGAPGRWYSELAASWLWVIALAGLFLWLTRPRKPKTDATAARSRRRFARARIAKVHGATGTALLIGFLFLSASGLTWSLMAGGNISTLLAALGWSTPQLPTALTQATPPGGAGKHDHSAHAGASGSAAADMGTYDRVLAAARTQDFMDSPKVEIAPPAKPGKAWTVTEIDRGWPTQVDAVAVDPATMKITGKAVFEDFPLAAKLTRWAIDLHMGTLFGLWNQLALVVLALGLAAGVVGGYLVWWKRRPTRGSAWALGRAPARRFLRTAPWPLTAAVAVVAIGVGVLVPLLGISLAVFLAVDSILAAAAKTA